jgi:hypothetical protein
MKRDVFATSNYYQKKWIQVRIDFHVVYKLHVGFEFLILQIVYFRVTDNLVSPWSYVLARLQESQYIQSLKQKKL